MVYILNYFMLFIIKQTLINKEMKNTVYIFTISILISTGCFSQNNRNEQVDNSVLNFYRQYSSFIDPGEYAYSNRIQ